MLIVLDQDTTDPTLEILPYYGWADSFTRADGPLGSTEVGAKPWQHSSTSSDPANDVGYKVVSGHAERVNIGTPAAGLRSFDLAEADSRNVRLSGKFIKPAAAYAGVGLVGLFASSALYYQLFGRYSTTGANFWSVYRYDGGTSSTLVHQGTIAAVTGTEPWLETTADTITFGVGEVIIHTEPIHANILAAGGSRFGVMASSNNSLGCGWDDLKCEALDA